MSTVIIFDEMGNAPISFLYSEEDLTRFDGVYINTYTDDIKQNSLQDELAELLWDSETGGEMELYKSRLRFFPAHKVLGGATVIIAGFML